MDSHYTNPTGARLKRYSDLFLAGKLNDLEARSLVAGHALAMPRAIAPILPSPPLAELLSAGSAAQDSSIKTQDSIASSLSNIDEVAEIIDVKVVQQALAPVVQVTTDPLFVRRYIPELDTFQAAGQVNSFWYSPTERLGAGAQGAVFRGLVRDDTGCEVPCAVKTMKKFDFAFRTEYKAVTSVKSPHVIDLLSFDESLPDKNVLVFPLANAGSLGGHLETVGALPLEDVLDLGVQLAKGLTAIHGARIIHRDIKPDNILLFAQAHGGVRAVVADFGLAAFVKEDGIARGFRGTTVYMAPEIILEEKPRYNSSVDVYSLGAVLYEVATGVRYCNDASDKGVNRFARGASPLLLLQHPAFDGRIGGRLAQLISRMLDKNPDGRPTAAYVMEKFIDIEGELFAFLNNRGSSDFGPPATDPISVRSSSAPSSSSSQRSSLCSSTAETRILIVTPSPPSPSPLPETSAELIGFMLLEDSTDRPTSSLAKKSLHGLTPLQAGRAVLSRGPAPTPAPARGRRKLPPKIPSELAAAPQPKPRTQPPAARRKPVPVLEPEPIPPTLHAAERAAPALASPAPTPARGRRKAIPRFSPESLAPVGSWARSSASYQRLNIPVTAPPLPPPLPPPPLPPPPVARRPTLLAVSPPRAMTCVALKSAVGSIMPAVKHPSPKAETAAAGLVNPLRAVAVCLWGLVTPRAGWAEGASTLLLRGAPRPSLPLAR
ncbi:hypothetical protein Q8F55_007635 [Vanrija albida]|uniref:non-specific serine/threonine protein kinase n=1 Tax=Vanrija albida TaxID=181172 RepID=A0ABR3PU36_9TREE